MDRLWQNVKDATRSVTVVKTLKNLIALIVIVLITGAYGTLKAHQANKIELTKTRLINQMANIYNNAGNIEVGQGYAGETNETYANDRKDGKKPFVVFDSPQMGLRAMMMDLRTKIDRHKGSLLDIITEYAPPSENRTDLYYNFVKSELNGDDMVNSTMLIPLVKAMVAYENGVDSETTNYYLKDSKIIQEAFSLSKSQLPSGTSYKKAIESLSNENN